MSRSRTKMVIYSLPDVSVKSKLRGWIKEWPWQRNQRRKSASCARGLGGKNGPEASHIESYMQRVADFSWEDRLIDNLVLQTQVLREKVAGLVLRPLILLFSSTVVFVNQVRYKAALVGFSTRISLIVRRSLVILYLWEEWFVAWELPVVPFDGRGACIVMYIVHALRCA